MQKCEENILCSIQLLCSYFCTLLLLLRSARAYAQLLCAENSTRETAGYVLKLLHRQAPHFYGDYAQKSRYQILLVYCLIYRLAQAVLECFPVTKNIAITIYSSLYRYKERHTYYIQSLYTYSELQEMIKNGQLLFYKRSTRTQNFSLQQLRSRVLLYFKRCLKLIFSPTKQR